MQDSYERIFRETGIPNLMIRGEPGASDAAFPKGRPKERIARLIRRTRHRLRRTAR